jgi:hypothetical protein
MNNSLELVSAFRQSIKALDFEIAALKKPRRGLLPYELQEIQDQLLARQKAKWELTEYLNSRDLSIY